MFDPVKIWTYLTYSSVSFEWNYEILQFMMYVCNLYNSLSKRI